MKTTISEPRLKQTWMTYGHIQTELYMLLVFHAYRVTVRYYCNAVLNSYRYKAIFKPLVR